MDIAGLRYLVVGAGFFGSVVAERIAADTGERVLLIDKRAHIGGNSFSEVDRESGIEYHSYGSHIFHTSSEVVWDYVNSFTSFNNYRHKVLTTCQGKVYPMPINLTTINGFYGLNLTPAEAEEFITAEAAKEGLKTPENLEEKAVSLVGRPLYEALIKGYTVKQWETDPRELPAEIINRLPVRFNYDSWYFDDPWQGIPVDGYGGLFKKMLTSKNIELRLDTDFFDIRSQIPKDCLVVYTGPIDRYFDYKHGALGWRSLEFDTEVARTGDFQGTAVMNYGDPDVPYTRIHEFRHYHPERDYRTDKSFIMREFSKKGCSKEGDPSYPINTEADRTVMEAYKKESAGLKNVIFGGRLGGYRYINMDQAIQWALTVYDESVRPWGRAGGDAP